MRDPAIQLQLCAQFFKPVVPVQKDTSGRSCPWRVVTSDATYADVS